MFAEQTSAIETERIVLAPLRIVDAREMVEVLGDRELYRYTGGNPPDLIQLQRRYRLQIGGSPVPGEHWHNWILRRRDTNAAIGYVQASVSSVEADVAWVLGTGSQGQGFAREAAVGMCSWLRDQGICCIRAHIHPDHTASAGVAVACGLAPTDEIDDDGENLWLWPKTT